MSVQLTPLAGNPQPIIPIPRPVLLVGRHPEADVRFDSPTISRRHCCLIIASGRVMVRDLGSRHGVRVNGHVVDESAIRPGDEVAIAQYLYRLDVIEDPPMPTRTSAPRP